MISHTGAAQLRALANEFLMDETFSIERPVEYGSYSFLPIVLNPANGSTAEYMNAAEAIDDGSLLISEVGDAVESILAKNQGSRPILIEAAEVLKGDNTQVSYCNLEKPAGFP